MKTSVKKPDGYIFPNLGFMNIRYIEIYLDV